MSAGDPFYCFSSDGAYNIASANTQNAITGTAATTTTYSGIGLLGGLTYGGTGSGLTYGGTGIGQANQFHTTVQYVTQPSSLIDSLEKATKPAKKKLKGLLAQLRAEVDGWHGDILERCPA